MVYIILICQTFCGHSYATLKGGIFLPTLIVKCTVRIDGGKIKDIAFERDELYPEQKVWSKVVTDGYETRKDALTRFFRTDHPFRTGYENAMWDSMLHNMRDFAVFG